MSKITAWKKVEEHIAFEAYNGEYKFHLGNKITIYILPEPFPQKNALFLVQCLQEHTPIDNHDPDWVVANDILQGNDTMDLSHAGGENVALEDLCDGVNETHFQKM